MLSKLYAYTVLDKSKANTYMQQIFNTWSWQQELRKLVKQLLYITATIVYYGGETYMILGHASL